MQSSSKVHLWSLDHLRALAAFLVFFWHAVHQRGIDVDYRPSSLIASFFEEGHSGVALFICISGFVFTVLTHGQDIRYFAFLKNRFIRLFPLVFLFSLFAVSAEGVDKGTLFLFANLLGGGVVYGTWTLAIEFQFYIAFPFIRKIFWRNSRLAAAFSFVAIVSLFLFFRAAFYLQTGNAQEIAYWTMFGRADQFLFGMLAGVVFVKVRENPPRWLRWVVWPLLIAAALLTAGYYDWFNETGGYYNRGGYPSPSALWIYMPTIEGVLWSSVIALYCVAASGWNHAVSRMLSYLGTISYSMYMIHYLTLPAITALLKDFEPLQLLGGPFVNQSLIVIVIYYPVTLLLSAICYETIERPFLAARSPYLVPSAVPESAVSRGS